jgi:hypothetical protein
MSAILKLWKTQNDAGSNNVTKETLRSERVTRLLNLVRNREKLLKRLNYREKCDRELSPYAIVGEIGNLSMELFNKNGSSPTLCQASLRDRFVFLLTTFGILRGESLFRAELSDLMLFTLDGEAVKCDTLILRIDFGKTNNNSTLFGRAMRHKELDRCPLGALGLYLFSRFHLANERLDFTENKNWFDVKLLVANGSHNNTVSVKDQVYAAAIKTACKKLNLIPKHFIHIGRSTGTIQGEICELTAEELRGLGNWNPDTYQRFYSSKLPLSALRGMAGHPKGKGLFFLARALIEPPDSLKSQVFPFVTEDLIDSMSSQNKSTSLMFLKMLVRLRSIILQDVACMVLQGLNHAIFSNEIFRSADFLHFCVQMRSALDGAKSKDPQNKSIDSVLPGVLNQFEAVNSHLLVIQNKLDTQETSMANAVKAELTRFAGYIGQYTSRSDIAAEPTTSLSSSSSAAANPLVSAIPGLPSPLEVPEPIAERVEFRMDHCSVTEIYSNYYGLGSYALTCPGGFNSLEGRFKAKWRKDFNSQQSKYYSRLKYIVSRVDSVIAAGKTADEVLEAFDRLITRFKSISGLEKYLKEHPNSSI